MKRPGFLCAAASLAATMLSTEPAGATLITMTVEANVTNALFNFPLFPVTLRFVFNDQKGIFLASTPTNTVLYGSGPDGPPFFFDFSPGTASVDTAAYQTNGSDPTHWEATGSTSSQLQKIVQADGHEYISVSVEDQNLFPFLPQPPDGLTGYHHSVSLIVQRPDLPPPGQPNLYEPLTFISSDQGNSGSFLFDDYYYVTGPTQTHVAGQLDSRNMKVTITVSDLPPPPSVPEPSTIALLGAGLIGIIGRSRLRVRFPGRGAN